MNWHGSDLHGAVQRLWYEPQPGAAAKLLGWLLTPAEWLHQLIAGSVRRRRHASRRRLAVPAIAVGNITAGGTGKTPLVIWLARRAQTCGLRPGVVSRGYGRTSVTTRLVEPDDDWRECGDEPMLIRQHCGAPVAVGRDRFAAARLLIESGCNLIISDDGLQGRDVEPDLALLLVDEARGLGNGRLLPKGPLRERVADCSADILVRTVVTGAASTPVRSVEAETLGCRTSGVAVMGKPRIVDLKGNAVTVSDLGADCVAVCGIGNPGRFATTVAELGLEGMPMHVWPDHHVWSGGEPELDRSALLTTAKDAIRLQPLQGYLGASIFVVQVSCEPEAELDKELTEWLRSCHE